MTRMTLPRTVYRVATRNDVTGKLTVDGVDYDDRVGAMVRRDDNHRHYPTPPGHSWVVVSRVLPPWAVDGDD